MSNSNSTLSPRYLAALAVVDANADDEDLWRSFLREADDKPDAPESIRGFLAAVRDCVVAQPLSAELEWLVDELSKRVSIDPETASRVKQQRRIQRLSETLRWI